MKLRGYEARAAASVTILVGAAGYCGSCCRGRFAQAFLLPLTPVSPPSNIRTWSSRSRKMAAGKGFGADAENTRDSSRRDRSYGSSEASEAQAQSAMGGNDLSEWETEYKAYIKRTGQYLCSMSWEGHEEMGRGAIFANYDDARAGGTLNKAEKFGGIPSMYVPMTEFESMKEAGKRGEEGDLDQIMRRVKSYRPEQEFVVVFQAAGIMGADIVRPNVAPPEMAKFVVKSDGVSTIPEASGLDGVVDVD